ncbi:MAG TPA: hypothetical protein VM327_03960 [Candidatus Thermoplasmatota archaeon]|nr:hypothetical protein [Candidatus Thermoplasmatota archaeon]
MANWLRMDEQAAGQVVAFMVAGAIFLAAVGAVLVVSQGAAKKAPEAREANKQVQAAGLADILFGSPGVGWGSDPDTMQRLGLLAGNGSGLDATHMEALRGGMADSSDNGKVDYEDALLSLGLDPNDTAGFHLRIYPVGLNQVATPHNLRIAYVADWTSLVTVSFANPVLPLLTAETGAMKANVALNGSISDPAKMLVQDKERQAIRGLGMSFRDRMYLTTGSPRVIVDYPGLVPDKDLLGGPTSVLNLGLLEGDVYPDHRDYLRSVLPSRLARYDVVIVGSGVDHASLLDSKEDIKNWVTVNGGTLIVLGSPDQSTAWLNPLLNVGVNTVNGAPTAPDIAHPLLKEPNALAWTSYDSFGQGWDIQERGAVAAYQDFSHVIIQDGEDVLAVSKEASFGEGRVLLTTYRPGSIAGSISLLEAKAFLENMVTYADRSLLYLDYGGMVPADQPVALSVRQSWLWDDVYGQVTVRMEVLAWG